MRFDLEDRKKIELICDLLKAFSTARSNVFFVWHKTEGWALLQNQEYLDNLDSSNMVNLCHIKPHFFSNAASQGIEYLCFEFDSSNLSRVLKGIKYSIKRMVWQCEPSDESMTRGTLNLIVCMDEGQVEVQKEVFYSMRINPLNYFRIFKEFIEEKTQYLEIKQSHMSQFKELEKNECVFFKFFDEFVSVYNRENENTISIRKNALEKYDYSSLASNMQGKNRLTIPPNFLVPQVLLGLKMKDPIQLFIGDDIVDDHISVSLRTKSDSLTFISQFKSIMERDEEDYRENPFDNHKLKSQKLLQLLIPEQNEQPINLFNKFLEFQAKNKNQNCIQSEPEDAVVSNIQIQDILQSENKESQMINERNPQPPLVVENKDLNIKQEQQQLLQFLVPNQLFKEIQRQPLEQLDSSVQSNQIISVNSTEIQGHDISASFNPYRFSNRNFASQVISRKSDDDMIKENKNLQRNTLKNLNKKRRSYQQEGENEQEYEQLVKENIFKKIKKSNYAETHQCTTPRSDFINPLISQDKPSPFSIYMAQNTQIKEYSTFLKAQCQSPIQFDPQTQDQKFPQLLKEENRDKFEKIKYSIRKF